MFLNLNNYWNLTQINHLLNRSAPLYAKGFGLGPIPRKTSTYQNSEGRSYEVTLKAGSRGYGRLGVTGLAGVYNVGVRTRPQLIGCALAQEPGVLNFGLGLQTMEGDEYAETGR